MELKVFDRWSTIKCVFPVGQMDLCINCVNQAKLMQRKICLMLLTLLNSSVKNKTNFLTTNLSIQSNTFVRCNDVFFYLMSYIF